MSVLQLMDRYIGKQIISATFFGVTVLSALLLMGNIFKELQPLLVEEKATPLLIGQFILSVIPFSLIYTIPWGFLVAVLLVFGKLSAENELISMRMAGQSLARIAMPVFIIGTLLSALCLWLNIAMAPKAKDNMKAVLFEAVRENPNALLDPGVVQTRFQGQKIFIEGREGDTLHGLHLYQLNEEDDTLFPPLSTYSREAKLKIVEESKQIRLNLTDAYIESRNLDGSKDILFVAKQEPLLFDFSADRKKRRKANTMTNDEIRSMLASGELKEPKKINSFKNEIHRRYAFSCSCLALALVAVPLGINARRKETSTGLAISIGVGLGYFLLSMVAKEFQNKSGNTAIYLFWLPNLICVILSIFLFRRARNK